MREISLQIEADLEREISLRTETDIEREISLQIKADLEREISLQIADFEREISLRTIFPETFRQNCLWLLQVRMMEDTEDN